MFEETGVKSSFHGLLGLRELMQFRYGATDFYMVCLMKPCSEEEERKVDIIDKREIYAA